MVEWREKKCYSIQLTEKANKSEPPVTYYTSVFFFRPQMKGET